MSDLVKTGNEIIHDAWEPREVNEQNKILNIKYLVLPFGLDTIQTMLLSNSDENGNLKVSDVFSVFARFKKEHGIKEE